MPSMLIGDFQTIAGAAVYNVQPPAGQAYCIGEIASDQAFAGDVPDIQLSIEDGVLAVCIVVLDPATAVIKGGRSFEIYIDNGHYLVITNTAVGAAEVAWTGHRVRPDNVRTDVQTAPNAASYDFQPPVGETWKITEVGAETMGAANNPDITFCLTDGVLFVSQIMEEDNVRKQGALLNWYIDNTTYLRVTDTSGADNDVAISAIRVPVTSIGDVIDLAAPGNLDIQPPAGEQWVITEISAEQFAGAGAPNNYPDISVELADGATDAFLAEDGGQVGNPASLFWNKTLFVEIDNGHYLHIINENVAACEVGWSGFLQREYTP